MSKQIRFPTGTRFGWLGLLVLAIVLASLEDAVFPVNGFLGRILGLLGIASATACIIEFIDHWFGGEEKSPTNNKHSLTQDRKHSWFHNIRQVIVVGLGILAAIILVFLTGAAL